MSPFKPTRGSSKRGGLPKPSAPEPVPARVLETGVLDELPSDLSALASILESAMAAGTSAFGERPDIKSQSPNPEAQAAISPDAPDDDVETEIPGEQELPAVSAAPNPRTQPSSPSAAASEREAVAFDEVARSLAAAEACVPLLAQSTGLMRLAALDVVKAETARAGGLLQLLRFLRGDISLPITAVSTAVVIQRIAQAAEAERRLRGVALITRSSVADATCAGDETLLTNTVLALLLITFSLIEGVQNGRVTLAVTVNENNEIGLAVSQDHVPAPASWTTRKGPEELADAAQVVPAIALNAAQRLAREWRGRFAMAVGEHSTILTLWLPANQPRDFEPLPH